MTRCPNCGSVLNGEQNTPRARELYKVQRKDEAPAVHSDEWIPYLYSEKVL